MPIIHIQTIIQSTPQLVFDLARSIDLHTISTAHTKERAIAGTTTGLIALGEQVTWRAKHLGFYWELTSHITAYNPPFSFVDEQLKGVFKRFKHEHIFKYVPNGILMEDVFDYTAPLGILGNLADVLFLKTYMKKLLSRRNAIIKTYAESDAWRTVLKNP